MMKPRGSLLMDAPSMLVVGACGEICDRTYFIDERERRRKQLLVEHSTSDNNMESID